MNTFTMFKQGDLSYFVESFNAEYFNSIIIKSNYFALLQASSVVINNETNEVIKNMFERG